MVTEADKTIRVLCVEDSELDYTLILETLEQDGTTVVGKRVESEAELVAALASARWDVVISDHRLPQFSAQEALVHVQVSGLDLPFLIVSGEMGEDLAVESMRQGADDYLVKGRLKRLPVAVARSIVSARMRAARRTAASELEISEARLRSFALHLTQVRERERAAVTTEVHDAISGNLLAAHFALARAGRLLGGERASDPTLDAITREIREVTSLVQQAVDSSQRLHTSLNTSLLDQGIVAAIDSRLSQIRKRGQIQPYLSANPVEMRLPDSALRAAYFVTCELIDNVEQHAKAGNVWCTLFLLHGELTVVVRDDGAGCQHERLNDPGKFGIFAARERLRPLGGSIDFDCVYEGEGHGTTALLTIPLPAADTEKAGAP